MKKQILIGAMALAAMNVGAQVVVDTVYTGAGYANNIWYSLANDNQGTAPKNNWDLAFDASGFGSTIHINTIAGAMLWNYPNSAAAGWASVDTTGLYTWPARYNSDTSWELGAMGRYANAGDPTDLDWGHYNMTTHAITGDSIYIVKLGDGSYKKLVIESLISGTYSFKYANLDGTSPQTATLAKSAYTGKNFGYYSLQTNAALDREPATANWDLFFGQYTTFIPVAYGVTGVLANRGVQVAKFTALVDKTTFTAYSTGTFKTAINTIGYNWKSYNSSTMAYDIKDSVVYFAETSNGEIWKMIFTGFASSNGAMMFSKEKLFTPPTSVNGAASTVASVAVYPNPTSATTSQANVIYSFPMAVTAANIIITDITGRTVLADVLDGATGMHQYVIPTANLLPGLYIINISAGRYSTQQKLIMN
ncbi:hypothetical protein GCM10023093_03680 [Nemorincola caseinilytica]|uniref:Secretion system C-terminal sorting domain-containing protein n=1 Tax=Nemorincola caseinilytica TaxID=2054315 RepID=A0ABP8N3G4_9BACT